LQANVTIDRTAASRLNVRVQDIANALNDAYAQRQISTLYTQRNQYRVILEIDPQYQKSRSTWIASMWPRVIIPRFRLRR
jgi:multidrug efflux pump